ncbi:thiamine phosphate synthase [Polaribacter atrinae]|uniref:Thiamine phosphate synthase n=1 Tax=Polaribacter atrinae TaxID=1333662 RepID=A0A176SZH9_9FLAO|nr:thiamine phosphate synthase [Polaribacter atrinae]OAD40821.1 thiamine phosphate synthase [Polaribacter atrinae]
MIPKLHYISQGNSPKEHLENIQKACSAGAELVQLKVAGISEKKYLKLALEAREITSHFQTRLILSNHYKIAKEVKADGVHLENIDFCATTALEHLYTWQIVGATANTLQDCNALISKKVDYITLSPFKDKETKENSTKDLGLNGFSLIVEALKTETPIIGAGGITTDDVADILETGVSGIAVSDAISQNFDSIKKFNELLNASSTQEQRHTF